MTLSKLSLAAVLVLVGLSAGVQAKNIDYSRIANDANTAIIECNQAIALLQTVNTATYPEAGDLLNRAVDLRMRANHIRQAALIKFSNTPQFLGLAVDALQRANNCEHFAEMFRQHAHQLHDNTTRDKAHDVKHHFDQAGDKLRCIKCELD
jgi:hypothetical protein